jgi:hypothetical protein
MAEASTGQASVNVNFNIELDLVKAAEHIVAAAAEAVAWAERSCVIEVDNQLPFPLAYESSESIHGGFSETPEGIPPMSPDVFNSRSSGLMTGTEGKAAYRFGDNYKLSIHWMNPFAGGNETHCLVGARGRELPGGVDHRQRQPRRAHAVHHRRPASGTGSAGLEDVREVQDTVLRTRRGGALCGSPARRRVRLDRRHATTGSNPSSPPPGRSPPSGTAQRHCPGHPAAPDTTAPA